MVILYLDNELRTSRDLTKENGFTLKITKYRQYLVEIMIDADYIDDLEHFVNTHAQTEFILHGTKQIAEAPRELK